LVISAQDFSEKIFAKINDQEIRKLNRIGNIDQVTNTSRILENVETISKFKYLYNFEAHK